MGVKGQEVEEWRELLGASSDEEYLQMKSDIQVALKENKKSMPLILRLKVYVKNGKSELHREMACYKKV